MSTSQQQHRAISIRVGLLARADGSCQWTQGNTSVLVAVYGPHTPKRREHSLPDRAYISVKVLEDQPKPSHQHTAQTNPTVLKQVIHNAFRSGSFQIIDSLYPRSQISIVLQVINDDGAVR
jgi:ribonuclease PH